MSVADNVIDKLSEAEELLADAHRLIVSGMPDLDVGEDGTLRRLRRLREDVSDLCDRIESGELEDASAEVGL